MVRNECSGRGAGEQRLGAGQDIHERLRWVKIDGARPLQRSIQRLLEDPLAEDILSKKITPGNPLFVDVDPDGKKLLFSAAPTQKAVKS